VVIVRHHGVDVGDPEPRHEALEIGRVRHHVVQPATVLAEVFEIQLGGPGNVPSGVSFRIPEIHDPHTLMTDVVLQPIRIDQEPR
jgi:hypothetical protein